MASSVRSAVLSIRSLHVPTRLNAIQIAVDVDLQKYRRMVTRPSRRRSCSTIKRQCSQIAFVNNYIDDPNRIVFADVVIETFRQQRDLASVLAFNESSPSVRLHQCIYIGINAQGPSLLTQSIRFHTASGLSRRSSAVTAASGISQNTRRMARGSTENS
jgi:hypothetical protein